MRDDLERQVIPDDLFLELASPNLKLLRKIGGVNLTPFPFLSHIPFNSYNRYSDKLLTELRQAFLPQAIKIARVHSNFPRLRSTVQSAAPIPTGELNAPYHRLTEPRSIE
jgi:hypothetical protein